MAQHMKEKIKHWLHHDKPTADQETTPGASPGYADVETVPTNTTTNIPEAFYPGARQVHPMETHPTNPYTGSLGQAMKFESGDESATATIALETYVPGTPANGEAPQSAPAVPLDSAAMLGIPPVPSSGGPLEAAPSEEATPAPAPSPEDKGFNGEQTPEKGEEVGAPTEPEDLKKDLPVVPVSDVKTVDSPLTESDVQTKNYPDAGPQDDVQENNYTGTEPKDNPGSVSDVEPSSVSPTDGEPTEEKPEETNLQDGSEAEPRDSPGSVSDKEPSPVPSTDAKPTEEKPEKTNLQDDSSYSPTEEHTEEEPPVSHEKISDMVSEGGPNHHKSET